ncbi:MAG: aminotransferase class I/II-fold pyridoxal phosphate-dependent enzyme [Firmicutes bacterium]|nr:aminotransferase class I/II-fold pyridoxal phosphate-dependent enzyme [Bacillota bacterium]
MFNAHGGDLDSISRRYNIPKEEIMDFSGNINPLGFPESVKEALKENLNLISIYPDKNYVALRECIADYTGASPEHICVGNGSTELISAYIRSINAQKTIILSPAYSEYERELKLTDCNFEYFPLKEENDFLIDMEALLLAITSDIDLLIICNPNNPTGTAIDRSQMEKILIHCKKTKTAVMVDETYIEFSARMEELSSVPLAECYDNIFIIRGISKFFAAPGLRLGYGICSNESFLAHFLGIKDPWSVNILAAFAGERLFAEKEFMARTSELIHSESKKACEELSTWKNIKFYRSESNFILLKLLTDKITSDRIFEKLIAKKILLRNAESFTFLDNSYLRFSFLTPEKNALLLRELKKLVEE